MNTKEKILNAAATLFYNDGIAATGIDRIIAVAGVAKMSLYNNFGSKSELVAAYIEARHQEWLSLYEKRLERAKDPRAKLLAIFLAYQDHAEFDYDNGFRGCGLLNAAAEMPAGSPSRLAVKQHKDHIHKLVKKNVSALLILPEDHEEVCGMSDELAFLLEGAISLAGLEASSDKMRRAYCIAERIVGKNN
ncbi:TetR/AcrR family transcriptional regulator [Agaribacter flavus]|uniref:TetR/AcrR family transcriptional regulator n=1 Tax=Agaribacter flavus TaxID=1902781 RepID=A0ABV7FRV7_9ALTE